MIVEELAAKLGIDVDTLSFTKAILVADGLKFSLQGVADIAKNVANELIKSVTGTAEYGGQLKDLSERTGVSTDALQEMRFAAERAGAPFTALTGGIRRLQMAAGQANAGNKAFSSTFQKLGVSLKDSNGQMKTGDVLMYDVAGAISKLGSDSERTAMAQKMFGMSGQALLPIMKDNENALGAQAARFREMGLAMDEDTINKADDFGDALYDLNTLLATFRRDIAGPLLAPLTQFINRLLAVTLVIRNAIKSNIDVYLERIKWGLMAVGAVILGAVLPGLLAKIAAMAVTASWYAALTVASLLYGKTALLASLMPILGWLALAAVIVMVGEDLYQFFTGGESLIGELVEGPLTWLQESFLGIIDEIGRSISTFFGNMKNWGTAAIDWVIAKFLELKTKAIDLIKSLPGGELLLKGGTMLYDAEVAGLKAVGDMAMGGSRMALDAAFGPAAATPAASALLGPTNTMNRNSQSFKASIVVNSPHADPTAVAGATRDAFMDAYQTEMSAAVVAAEVS